VLLAEELLIVIELVKWILGTIVSCEFKLVEAWRTNAQAGTMSCLF
jgi:hypothetical protein